MCVCTDCVRGKRYLDGPERKHYSQEWQILSWTSGDDKKLRKNYDLTF